MIMKNSFANYRTDETNPRWNELITRCDSLYKSTGDIRSEFSRDYTRVLHSYAFRRLKHKTQVFFNGAGNDHVCTRMEHVLHVGSVASTIATYLGLNVELVQAIAMAHDLGHAPFGHHGEAILSETRGKALGPFWHERNGLYFTDNIELLQNHQGEWQNLNLTYAVRDGIISHCGEVDKNELKPRTELIDLYTFKEPGQYEASTWEGCVVKLADKIAYIGRDIEDADALGYFGDAERKILQNLSIKCMKNETINTTTIIHNMIINLCENSSPEKGLCFSKEVHENLKAIKEFNYHHIYNNRRLNAYKDYAELVIVEIKETLLDLYQGEETIQYLAKRNNKRFIDYFKSWLAQYCEPSIIPEKLGDELNIKMYKNKKIYNTLADKHEYEQAISDFIAGMTDVFAIESFEELLRC